MAYARAEEEKVRRASGGSGAVAGIVALVLVVGPYTQGLSCTLDRGLGSTAARCATDPKRGRGRGTKRILLATSGMCCSRGRWGGKQGVVRGN